MIATTRSRAIAAFAALLTFAAVAPAASAQAIGARAELTLSQLESHLSQQGYRVLEIERDDGRYEVKAFDRSGACVELDVDRRSGDVIRSKSDDDCGASNRSRR